MPESRLLRTLVSPYVLGERGRYNIEMVEKMTDEKWSEAVIECLQSRFEVITSGKAGSCLVKLTPLGSRSDPSQKCASYMAAGDCQMRALANVLLTVLQSPDRDLLPHPQGISTALRVLNM